MLSKIKNKRGIIVPIDVQKLPWSICIKFFRYYRPSPKTVFLPFWIPLKLKPREVFVESPKNLNPRILVFSAKPPIIPQFHALQLTTLFTNGISWRTPIAVWNASRKSKQDIPVSRLVFFADKMIIIKSFAWLKSPHYISKNGVPRPILNSLENQKVNRSSCDGFKDIFYNAFFSFPDTYSILRYLLFINCMFLFSCFVLLFYRG